jgi:hypothetical protein
MTDSVDSVPRAISSLRQLSVRIEIERHAAKRILSDTEPIKANPRALPGDTHRLRGIPAIGLGVQGAIGGTRPDTSVR